MMRFRNNHWIVLGCVLFSLAGCGERDSEPRPHEIGDTSKGTLTVPTTPSLLEGLDVDSPPSIVPVETGPAFHFNSVAENLGLSLTYSNGYSAAKLMPAATSGGIGCLDFDRDGWMDLIMPQGGSLPWLGPSADSLDELARNIRGERFQAATQQSLIVDTGYGHGVGVCDFDNDGFDDFYVANVGEDALFRNLGDGTFEIASHNSGITNPAWASSVAFCDFDSDGNADIFVCNYVDYDPRHPIGCFDDKNQPATCHPKEVGEVPNKMFLNLGDGQFAESSDDRGMNAPGSKSLGVVAADFDLDGDQDVYVANDTEPNHLLINDGKGMFRDEAVARGAAASGLGHYQASMGVAYGDYDRDGWTDLYVTHFIDDSNTLYRNLGQGVFSDETRSTCLHQETLEYLGFGTVMSDFDADGWLDIFIANGHIDDWRDRTGDPWKMKPQIFRGKNGQWAHASSESGAYFEREVLGRGVAHLDFDNDGDQDLVIVHQNENVGFLENATSSGHWISLDLVGLSSNRCAVGATIHLEQGRSQWIFQCAGGGSYCSASERRVFIGLGDSPAPVNVTIRWPMGSETRHALLDPDRHYVSLENGRLVSE